MRFDFTAVRVLVVGDVFLDRYVHGRADRLSPEAPVPVLKQEGESQMLGGAGNVAANIVALGGKAMLAGAIGSDEPGAIVRLLAGEAGIEIVGKPAAGRTTAVKTRYMAGHQQVMRVDQEAVGPVGGIPFVDGAIRAVKQAGVVVLSDYDKGVLTLNPAQAIIAAAKRRQVPVIADPRVADWRRYAGANVVTPNRGELAQADDRQVSGDEEIAASARRLIAANNLGAVVATRSEEGLSIVTADKAEHIRARARAVFDVSGAGDTVVAALACGLGAGMEIAAAARLANIAAGLVVAKSGTATVSAAELMDAIATKVCGLDALVARVRAWRAQGLTVGFTNGCFDLLHAGHVETLEFARAQCDRLIVAVNSDRSVTRLKGPGRPVNRDRAIIVASIGRVDAVVEFDAETPVDLLEAIRPDVMVKGEEYRNAGLVGTEFARRVAFAPMVAGVSTTDLINRCSATT